MNISLRTVIGSIVALLALGTAVPAYADALDAIQQSKKIRVATDIGVPPFGMLDGSMQPVGSDISVAKALAADWGVELELINVTGPTRIPSLETDKADVVISSLSITEERKKVIDYTRPYSFIRTAVIGLTTDPITDWEDLRGKSVAVVRTTAQDTALTGELEQKYGFTVVRFDDDATAITAAVSGQADYLGLADPQMHSINQRSGNRQFEAKLTIAQFPIGMGVKKGETALVEKLNEWISANIENGKLNAYFAEYHNMDIPAEILQSE